VRTHRYAADAQRVTEKYVKSFLGKDKIQAALQRLDRLTSSEGLAAGAQTLAVVHNLQVADNEAKKMKRLFFSPYLLLPRLTVSC
jgi:hypothetical protein